MQSSTASATTRATASAETRRRLLHHLNVSHPRVPPVVYQLPWQLSYSAPNYSFRISNSKLLCRPESRDPIADTIAEFRSRLRGNNGSIIGGGGGDDDDDDDDDDLGWEGLQRSSRWKTKQKKEGRRTWWSDNEHLEDDDDDEEGPSNLWEEFVDSIWIWKVIESYGWFSPLIISSLLLVSGPKAFLIALALPLGQSTLTFILNKIGVAPLAPLFTNNTRPRGNKRRSRSSGSFYSDDLAEDDANIEEEGGWFKKSPKMRKKKKKRKNSGGYQSWVAAAEAARRKRRMNNGSVSNKSGNSSGGSKSSSFGGWDDLIMIDGEKSNAISNKETKTSRREHKSAEATSKHNKEWRENGTDSVK